MALITALNFLGFDAIQAAHLGWNAETSIAATGNASQANAYQLTANLNGVTTVTAIANGVKLPKAESAALGIYLIRNQDAADNLNVYPYSGDRFGTLAIDAPITLTPGTSLLAFKQGPASWLYMVGT